MIIPFDFISSEYHFYFVHDIIIEKKSQVSKDSIFALFMTIFDILVDPYHGPQILRTQLQIKLPDPSKGCKNTFPQISERMGK